MSEQSEEVRNYLRKKYRQGDTSSDWDPWINPDEGYIPYCASCLACFDGYKIKCEDTCDIEHTSACLWYDYFVSKIKKLNPSVRLVLKRGS